MKLVFGLGNPGDKYAKTRHNAGFLAWDELAKRLNALPEKKMRGAMVRQAQCGTEKVLLIKPQTFMNDSGVCVMDFAAYYKAALTDLLVLYDDIDLPCGTIRIRAKGGAGTHNGMRSILAHLGEGGFPRVRLGVGAPPAKWDLVDYVLGVPKGEDEKAFLTSVEHGAAATELLLTRGVEAAQQAYNGA